MPCTCRRLHACGNARDVPATIRACVTHSRDERQSVCKRIHWRATSLDSNFACCSTRALRRFPFCGWTKNDRPSARERERERERERDVASLARGVARVSSGHLFNWEPTWPLELTPAFDRPICTITSLRKCVACHVRSVFRPVTLIPSLHIQRRRVAPHSVDCVRVCVRSMRSTRLGKRAEAVLRFYKFYASCVDLLNLWNLEM